MKLTVAVLAAALLGLIAPPSKAAQSDLCRAVTGLCAQQHLSSLEELRRSVGPSLWKQVLATQALLSENPPLWARTGDPALRGMAGSGTDFVRRGTSVDGAGKENAAGNAGLITSVFGPRARRGEDAFLNANQQRGAQPNRITGWAGSISGSLQQSSRSLPGRAGWAAGDGELPGQNSQPSKDPPAGAIDVSSPNRHGGTTRVTVENGNTKVVETMVNPDGSSAVVVTVANADGSASFTADHAGPEVRGDDQYIWVYHAERSGPIGFWEYRVSESTNGGDTWQLISRGRTAEWPHRVIARNVDPDAPASRSKFPPVCALANPDCDLPLLVRFVRDRPGVRSRPDDSPLGDVPRLRTDQHGTVVNPGLEPAAGGSLGSSGRSSRSFDGGALVNPAGERPSTGTNKP
jgi:hypothetical protein